VSESNRFQDPRHIEAMYRDGERQRQRSSELLRAKVSGDNVNELLAGFAVTYGISEPAIVDIGCGRGSLLMTLAQRCQPSRMVGVDQSGAMLAQVRQRIATVETYRMDFHRLDIQPASFDIAAAANCLYHSPHPAVVLAQVHAVLRPRGVLLVATKSRDSYVALDHLMAHAGVDSAGPAHPSLYSSFHTDNALELIAAKFVIVDSVRQRHDFLFTTPTAAARYAVTVPKYDDCTDARLVADQLARVWPPTGLTMTSDVLVVVAQPR
jgi:SAM-dependent methyltransferase